MKKETVDEFLNRGGKIEKIKVDAAYYRKYSCFNGLFKDYVKSNDKKKTIKVINKMEGRNVHENT